MNKFGPKPKSLKYYKNEREFDAIIGFGRVYFNKNEILFGMLISFHGLLYKNNNIDDEYKFNLKLVFVGESKEEKYGGF